MLISDLHSSKVISCGGELNQSECLYKGQRDMEGAECMIIHLYIGKKGTKGVEGMTYIGVL